MNDLQAGANFDGAERREGGPTRRRNGHLLPVLLREIDRLVCVVSIFKNVIWHGASVPVLETNRVRFFNAAQCMLVNPRI